MSVAESTRPKKGRPEPKQNLLPAILSALIVVAVFVVLGFMLYNNQPGAPQTTAQPTVAGEQPAAQPTAAGEQPAAQPPAQPATGAGETQPYSAPPAMAIDPVKNYTATITTPRGDIVVKLRPDLAPQTVNSFVFLAREGFYNGLTWHRVLPNFMAQGGDPTGTGMGGPGYNVPAEFTDVVKFDRPGLVAMARASDPNSAGSQFFITTAPAPNLDGQYTIFGEVVQGQEVVDGIPLRDPDQNPTTPGEQMLKIMISEP
jgi:peptidylprolyl isomerase